MSLFRLRKGEVLALVATVALFCLLFTTWAAPEKGIGGSGESGWSTLGWAMVALLVVLMICATALVVLTVTERDTPVLAVVAFVWTSAIGIITSVALLIRLTLAQPALAGGLSDQQVHIHRGAWLGLLAVFAITAGGWIAMGDERTEAATSEVPDAPVRPAPPAGLAAE